MICSVILLVVYPCVTCTVGASITFTWAHSWQLGTRNTHFG